MQDKPSWAALTPEQVRLEVERSEEAEENGDEEIDELKSSPSPISQPVTTSPDQSMLWEQTPNMLQSPFPENKRATKTGVPSAGMSTNTASAFVHLPEKTAEQGTTNDWSMDEADGRLSQSRGAWAASNMMYEPLLKRKREGQIKGGSVSSPRPAKKRGHPGQCGEGDTRRKKRRVIAQQPTPTVAVSERTATPAEPQRSTKARRILMPSKSSSHESNIKGPSPRKKLDKNDALEKKTPSSSDAAIRALPNKDDLSPKLATQRLDRCVGQPCLRASRSPLSAKAIRHTASRPVTGPASSIAAAVNKQPKSSQQSKLMALQGLSNATALVTSQSSSSKSHNGPSSTQEMRNTMDLDSQPEDVSGTLASGKTISGSSGKEAGSKHKETSEAHKQWSKQEMETFKAEFHGRQLQLMHIAKDLARSSSEEPGASSKRFSAMKDFLSLRTCLSTDTADTGDRAAGATHSARVNSANEADLAKVPSTESRQARAQKTLRLIPKASEDVTIELREEPNYTGQRALRSYGSVRLMQNTTIDRALEANGVEVIDIATDSDRESDTGGTVRRIDGRRQVLAEPDLVIGPMHACFFYKLGDIYKRLPTSEVAIRSGAVLSSHRAIVLESVRELSRVYEQVTIIFEAFGPTQDLVTGVPTLDPRSAQADQALLKLRSELDSLADQRLEAGEPPCEVLFEYADSPNHAACLVRERVQSFTQDATPWISHVGYISVTGPDVHHTLI